MKQDLPPEELRETATHVITGRVTAVYERTTIEVGYRTTRYVAEVRVDGHEKGEGITIGDLVYVRYWHHVWASFEFDDYGHRETPSEGSTVRVYLARNAYDGYTFDNKDGGFNVIGANGFETLNPTPAR